MLLRIKLIKIAARAVHSVNFLNDDTKHASEKFWELRGNRGYSEDQIEQYFKMSGDMTVTKTHGKKSVGGINRMVMDAQYFDKKLEKDTKYQWELSEYLNRDICQPEGFDAYGYPSELFKLDMERLEIVPKRKPAKVIDFNMYIENNRGTNH